MVSRAGLSLTLLAIALVARADTEYVSIKLQGKKVGWSSVDTSSEMLNGTKVNKAVSKTVLDIALQDTPVKMQIDSTTWSLPSGAPKRMIFTVMSGGLSQTGDARFDDKKVEIEIVNSGKKSKQILPRPDGLVVDDPMTLALSTGFGKTTSFWVLDPMTVSFVKNEVKSLGPQTVAGKTLNVVRILDPRAWTDIYVSEKGDFVRAINAMGMEMTPSTREAALLPSSEEAPDLAVTTNLRPIGEIPNPRTISFLKLRLSGDDVVRLPSDGHQTVEKEGTALILSVHPTQFNGTATRVSVGGQKPEFLKPSLNIPSSSDRFKKLASTITAGQKTVRGTAGSIRQWVNARMIPNSGMGVLRDAEEVLDRKEGVCRDYAVLTTTLLRSAGIPSRLASGLIFADGAFYYHAWAEAWDGQNWVGVDSTLPEERMSAVHLKLADGNVDGAFTFSFLGKAKIEVLEAR
ncbi:transglutaminase family protein [bacterium]|nr:MAG: transglutaminase family protein [bacterium]